MLEVLATVANARELATVANVREVSDKFGNREAEAAKKRKRKRKSEKTCSSVLV